MANFVISPVMWVGAIFKNERLTQRRFLLVLVWAIQMLAMFPLVQPRNVPIFADQIIGSLKSIAP